MVEWCCFGNIRALSQAEDRLDAPGGSPALQAAADVLSPIMSKRMAVGGDHVACPKATWGSSLHSSKVVKCSFIAHLNHKYSQIRHITFLAGYCIPLHTLCSLLLNTFGCTFRQYQIVLQRCKDVSARTYTTVYAYRNTHTHFSLCGKGPNQPPGCEWLGTHCSLKIKMLPGIWNCIWCRSSCGSTQEPALQRLQPKATWQQDWQISAAWEVCTFRF